MKKVGRDEKSGNSAVDVGEFTTNVGRKGLSN